MAEMTATEVLTTTRAVRRRLDLERPVPLDVIWQCIDIALQAPTGGNAERWRWIVIVDTEQKKAVAEIYRNAALASFEKSREAAESEAIRRAYDGAIYLALNLERVPVIVIPCSLGRPPADPSGSAGFFGSILPATWSFQLALRSRGLGSTYTTAVLSRHAELQTRLSIPDDVTPAAMIPVAYTVGTHFKPAHRDPAETVAFIDRWGNQPTSRRQFNRETPS